MATPSKKIVDRAPMKKKLTPEMAKLVSNERKEELRLQAEVEVQAKRITEAEEAFFEEQRQLALEEADPDETLREIMIDLPSESPYILINGRDCYYPEMTYLVTKARFDVLQDQMWRAWVNEACRLDDRTANQYRRRLNARISRLGNVNDLGRSV